MLTKALNHYIAQRQAQGLYRRRKLSDKTLLNFSSNDYLSLVNDARIKQAYAAGSTRFPVGSGGSMLVSGFHPMHQALERAFACALNVDACLVFSSGYAANLSVIQLLNCIGAHSLVDKAAHASIYDGLALTGASYTRFLHNDMADFAVKVSRCPDNTVTLTESIFSMSGQIAQLIDLINIGKSYGFELIVDEAHAFGVLGNEGLGSVVAHNLTQTDVPLRIIPLGKAFGAFGAIVAGQGVWIEALLQAARAYIYSTAISPAMAFGLLETLGIVRHADKRREKLQDLIAYFRACIVQSPHRWRNSHSPIQQLQLGCPHQALLATHFLQKQGILCLPMRQPTVSRTETGLRVILNYDHTIEDINQLFESLIAYEHQCNLSR